nr:DMT family transporter [Propionicimonas sp.]
MDLRHARRGLGTGSIAGASYGLVGVVGGIALATDPLVSAQGIVTAALVLAALQMGLGGIWVTLWNVVTGRDREILRAVRTKPGVVVMVASLFGGVLAMVGFWVGLSMTTPAYALAISAMFPIVGAILAAVFLRERIVRRVWLGVLLAVAGAVVVGWTPPEGDYPHFYLGLILCGLATLGWGIEGVVATFGMDMVDPAIAVNIRELTAGLVFLLGVFPFVALTGGNPYETIGHIFTAGFRTGAFWLVLLCAFLQATTDLTWYRAMNTTGVARAMALNVTYAFWGFPFGFLLSKVSDAVVFVFNGYLVGGAVLIVLGVVLVIDNPRELVKLRNR